MRTGIALGSNLGDRLQHLRAAVAALRQLPEIRPPVRLSRIYETAPVDSPADAGAYYNAVLECDSDAPPAALLTKLQQIETQLGRPIRRPRHAPRTIDLDLLYLGDLTVAAPGLALPHPRLAERAFVLAPLADLRPELVLPGQHEPVHALLAKAGGAMKVLPDEL